MTNREIPTNISRRTKEGQLVFSGLSVFRVAHKVGTMLVLAPADASDYHHYVHNLEGGCQRFSSYQDALNSAVLPAVAAQVLMAQAAQ